MLKIMKEPGCWRAIMKTFKQYLIDEGKYPTWVRVSVGVMALKIKNLTDRIENEKDPKIQNVLIAKQNKLLGQSVIIYVHVHWFRRILKLKGPTIHFPPIITVSF